ncbi:unnamed protein product [Dimorphilus gyrociliatus]|uniref:RING-type domain-containing protein n=1 Tax=Dimorphilus gyrociliatus TaxID=2664684 RepID=A0A7I8VI16_9ANNE|nr:unnamed protein product [Dimorphilus gyrociliatus]
MTSNDEDINLNQVLMEEETICAICKATWIQKEPRCFPCSNIVHIFCTECIEMLAEHNDSEPGDTICCPICREEHVWTENGVRSFPRLGLFDMDEDKPIRRKIYTENYQNTENRVLCDTEKLLTASLGNLEQEEYSICEKINCATEKLAERISERNRILLNEVEAFFDKKKDEMEEIIAEFQEYDNFSSEEDGEMEMKIELSNKAISCLHRMIDFYPEESIEKLIDIGTNITTRDFTVKAEVCSIPKPCTIVTAQSYDNFLYLITEKPSNSEYSYNFYRYNWEEELLENLHEWICQNERQFKIAVNNKVYILNSGTNMVEYVRSITKKNYLRYQCLFKEFCFARKGSFYCNMTGWNNGIILTSEMAGKNSTILKLSDPFKIEWKSEIDNTWGCVIDMKLNGDKLITYFSEKSCCILDFNSGVVLSTMSATNLFFNGSDATFSCSSISFLTRLLCKKGSALSVFNNTYLSELKKNSVELWVYKTVFDLYKTFEYKKTSKGILVYFMSKSVINTVHIKSVE